MFAKVWLIFKILFIDRLGRKSAAKLALNFHHI